TVDNSIIQVSERAAQDEGQGRTEDRVAPAGGGQQNDGYRDQHDRRKSDEQGGAPRASGVGQHAESHAGVFGVDDVEQAGNHGNGIVTGKMRLDQAFGKAVQNHNQGRDDEREQ